MTSSEPQLQTTVLDIRCSDDTPECVVHFEPTGVSHRLRNGESLAVEAVLPPGYKIEVLYGPGSITVWAEGTWGIRVLLQDGSELAL
jgi:hypothetical protein